MAIRIALPYTGVMQDFIAILGRQPHIGMAELERVFGNVRWFAHDAATSFPVAIDPVKAILLIPGCSVIHGPSR